MKKKLVGFGALILSMSLMSTSAFADRGDRNWNDDEGKHNQNNRYVQSTYANPYANVDAFASVNPFQQDGSLDRQVIKQLINNQKEIASLKSRLTKDKKLAQLQQLMAGLANNYAEEGNYTLAIQAQQEGLRSNYQFGDIAQFQQLGQYYKQSGDTGIKAYVNGKVIQTSIQPFTYQGRTLVPLRAISEELQAIVAWDPATQSITVTRGANTVVFVVNSRTVTVNGQQKVLDVPAMITGGQTFIPLRALGELLGAHVTYIPEGNIAIIEDKSIGYDDDLNSQFPIGTSAAATTNSTTTNTAAAGSVTTNTDGVGVSNIPLQ